MNGLSPWLDLTPTRRAPDEGVVMGTVVAIHDQATGLVEVHVDGAPAGQTVITPSAAGLTYIGARVRVSRDTSGAAVMAHAPTGRAPAGTKTVAVGETGRALQDLTGRVNDLTDTSDADIPVLGWDSGIRATGIDVPPTYWHRLPLFNGGALAACAGFGVTGKTEAYEVPVLVPGLYAVSGRVHAWSTSWDASVTAGISVHRAAAPAPTNVLDTEPRGEAYAPPSHYACPAAHGIVRLAKGDTISLLVHNAQASTVGMWGWAISAHLVSKTTERKHQ